MRFLACLTLLALLAGCSGGGNQQRPVLPDFPGPNAKVSDAQRSLVFAYPASGQADVAPGAPIVLRFSHPIAPENRFPDAALPAGTTLKSLFTVKAKAASAGVDFNVSLVKDADGKEVGLLLKPMGPLLEKTEYQILAPKKIPVLLTDGRVDTITLPSLSFTTRAAIDGPTELQKLTPAFQVAQMTPTPTGFLMGSKPFGLVDFSTIRLLMTQPIDSRSVNYGSSIRLLQGSTLVPARVIVQGGHLSIDPEQDLDPTKSYTLSLSSGLKSILGEALVPGNYSAFTFTPQDSGVSTGKSSKIAVAVPDPANGALSLLLGSAANQAPVLSPLLGSGNLLKLKQGQLLADLALPANFAQYNPVVTPLRVPRGNTLKADPLVVTLNGGVTSGLNTEELTITLISDANGLLLPNRYSSSSVAPALVVLELDINVAAKNPTSSGAFTQDITHVQVAGIASVDQGTQTLTIEAVGAIELKVLGVDNATAVLALKLQTDLTKAPGAPDKDAAAPAVDSWVPGDTVNGLPGGEFIRPGDPIIVNFSEAMDIKSLQQPGAITLMEGSASVPFSWRLDGVSLIVSPDAPWQHGIAYRLRLGTGSSDISGNPLGYAPNFDFTIPPLATTKERPPIVLSNYPGFPCPIELGTRNLANNIQGRCAGGQAGDDLLPLPRIEPNRAIDIVLSQSLLANSIRLGTSCGAAASFRVERIDASGNCLGAVAGRLIKRPRDLHFMPEQLWVKDQLYRYVLGSNNNLQSSDADCDGTQSICGSKNLSPSNLPPKYLPLQTQLIAAAIADARNSQRGGPPMEIWFKGGDSLGGSNIDLRVLPVQDVNANLRLDDTERRAYLIANPAMLCKTGQGSDTPATSGSCIASNGALLQPSNFVIGSDGSETYVPNSAYSGAATSFGLGCVDGVDSDEPGSSAGGRQCQGNQFLYISAALAARLGNNNGDGSIPVYINPGMVVTSGPWIYAGLGLTTDASPATQGVFSLLESIPVLGPLITTAVDTGAGLVNGLLPLDLKDDSNTELPLGQAYSGPLVFRMRHPAGNGPILGTIRSVNGKLILETKLELYTDIPELNVSAAIFGQPALPVDHNVRSNVDLSAYDRPVSASKAHGSGTIEVSGEVKFLPDGRLTAQLSNKKAVRLTADVGALGGLVQGSLKVRVPAGRFVIDASLAPLKQ